MVTEDLEWLGLEPRGEGQWTFELASRLGRGDGKLYGGTGLAISVALMEAVTNRDALYCTTQFSGSANTGAQLDCQVEVLASGKRSSQLRITVSEGDRLVLTSLGATGEHNDALEVQVHQMPNVPGPEQAEDWMARFRLAQPNMPPHMGWAEIAELKRVELDNGHFAMWGRMRGHRMTRPGLGFIADFVPVSVTRAAGVDGAGFSLDNSIRYGYFVDTEWVLLDFDPWFAAGSYLHGAVRLFAEDGTLLGVASQTAAGFIRPPA